MSLLAAVLLVGCGEQLTTRDVTDDEGLVEDEDDVAPVIEHTPVSGTQTFGADVAIEATVTDDDSGVLFVYLHYKNEIDGSSDWESDILIPSGSVFTGIIPGDDHRGGGIDYYIEAVDKEQNSGFAPDDGESDPFHFRIAE